MTLPKLSVAAKLYAILALLATAILMLALIGLAHIHAMNAAMGHDHLGGWTEGAFIAVVVTALLGAAGSIAIIRRSVTEPLVAITRVTEQVAAGDVNLEIPYSARTDEIGALARSIAVFQEAMQHVKDLSERIAEDSEAEKRSQSRVSK